MHVHLICRFSNRHASIDARAPFGGVPIIGIGRQIRMGKGGMEGEKVSKVGEWGGQR